MPEGSEPAPVGLVLVSHSARLAEGAAELARAMAGEDVRIVPAGGLAPPEEALGTDATRVAAAIEEAWSERGVLVLMDLGSALMSGEMAVELLAEERRGRILLSAAPLVEGAVAAAVAARLGEPLANVAQEAASALAPKRAQITGAPAPAEEPAPPVPEPPAGSAELRVAVDLPLGLHARPAARLIRATAGLDAQVVAGNASAGTGPVSARSLNALATLQVRQGQELLVRASGPDAEAALEAIRALAARRFDEPATAAPASPAPSGGPPAGPPEGARAEVAPRRAGPRTGAAGRAGPPHQLQGIPASPGTAVGALRFLEEAEIVVPPAQASDPAAELAALERAVSATRAELELLREQTRTRAGAYEAEIVDADLLFLEDPELLEPTREAIATHRLSAARAWSEVSARLRLSWEGLDDPALRLRAADLGGVSRMVLRRLVGHAAAGVAVQGILVARDLAPTDTAGLDPRQVLGIATAGGGPTSHSAILARALGIPAVVGLGEELLSLAEGTGALLDGDRGTLLPDPPHEVVRRARADAARAKRREARAAAAAHRPAVTRDGVTIEVAANIGSVEDAARAAVAGADGVGLLRTEFLFLEAGSMPTQAEQEEAYTQIARRLGDRPLTVRTLDVGADKPLPYLATGHEDNPALGLRGIRLGLARPEVLTTQLRAIVTTARSFPLRVMFPMVASVAEVLRARALLTEICAGSPPAMEVGVMVEVPSAALTAGRLAEHVDFFSLGTNDLSQYTLAADRTNAAVAPLADALHPGVLRLIRSAVEAADARGRWVGVCGELAGDVSAVPLLIGLGVRELSVAIPLVARVKEAVRAAEAGSCVQLARRALEAADGREVRALVGTQP